MSRAHPLEALSLSLLLLGCDGPAPRSDVPREAPDNATAAEISTSSKHLDTPPASPEAPPPVASASSSAPTAEARFALPPHEETRRTLAHILEPKARVGAYLGLPAGWRNDDPSYLLFFPRGEDKPPARAVAMTLVVPGLGADNQRRLLERGVAPVGLVDATWTAWSVEEVGRERFRATIALGEGASLQRAEGPRKAVAAVIDIPGAPALGFVGAWATSHPTFEAVIAEMLRSVERCQVEVGRGCVTAAERQGAAL